MTKQIPILFSTPMVQAILAGRKTVTRRIAKFKWIGPKLRPDNIVKCGGIYDDSIEGDWGTCQDFTTADQEWSTYSQFRAMKSDTLWVRETWNSYNESHYKLPNKEVFLYKANGTDRTCKWKPSIFMPKKACRIFLKITDIRIERLQDITEEQAKAEGIHFDAGSGYWFAGDVAMADTPRNCFRELWIKINGKKSWNQNPWVWVIEFKKIKK